MASSSSRVSSLLNRFKFESKPQKKLSGHSNGFDESLDEHGSSRHQMNGTGSGNGKAASRSSTPDLQEVTCIPDTPTSELPESIESGSPVFPSSSAKKRVAESSQRSLVSSTISSLLSPSGGDMDKSPTFDKPKHLTNGHSREKHNPKTRHRQINFSDSDSESDSELFRASRETSDSRQATKKSTCDTDSDSTHITNLGTQDSLETVAYSYEEKFSEEVDRQKGAKRKLSEVSDGSDESDVQEKKRERKDAIEQLRICFPRKLDKELRMALETNDWNVNQAANEIMQAKEPSPQKKQLRPPQETKKPSSSFASKRGSSSDYQGAFSGWLQKPTPVQQPRVSRPRVQRIKVISSSDDDDVPAAKRSEPVKTQPKKTYQRIRTFSSDSMEDMSPVKKTAPTKDEKTGSGDDDDDVAIVGESSVGKRAQRIRTMSGEDDDVEEVQDEHEAGGSSSKIANGFYSKSSMSNDRTNRKPFRKVWCGFKSDEGEAEKSSKDKKSQKAAKKSSSTKIMKPAHSSKPKFHRYSDSEEDLCGEGSDSEYEAEVEVSAEFRSFAESFFNDSTLEELVSVDGCSKGKAEKIINIRPFQDFNDLLERLDEVKGLGSHLVWNCETVYEERRVMEDLMARCTKISERIQKMVTDVIERPDSAAEGQITRQPALLNRSMALKPYQLVGLNWLKLMHAQEVNGILADEMGLGKTIQVISLLAHLLDEGERGPHLVVAPSSTIDNWMRELQKWCPALDVIMYHGSQDDRREIRDDLLYNGNSCNVIVTSYSVCISSPEDRGLFRKLPLKYAIFDEGHMLKNMRSQRYSHLMKIKAERRLLLTGTPLQNNLQELVSLLSFTLPRLFGGKASELTRAFSMKKQKSDNPNEQSSFERERIAHAKQIMQPFLLRRLKIYVLSQLPKKLERVEHCEMMEPQSKEYLNLKTSFSKEYKTGLKTFKTSAAMMELRKQANHSMLMRLRYDDKKLRKMAHLMLQEPTHSDANEDYIFEDMQVMSDFELHKLCHEFSVLTKYRLDQDLITQSAKFRMLDKLLPELKEQGSRVLLFSQFVIVLDIIQDYLKMRGHKFLRMDGQTQVTERAALIDKYNSDDSIFVFMLSTKAGGVGINLTAANTVIIHDIDFNPYNDKQAEDRCHRVGQTRDVSVIRLVTKNSIEDGMLACANYKLKLEQQMTTSNGEGGEEEKMDIETLLKEALDV